MTLTHRSERKAERSAAKLAQQEADRRIEADVLAVELKHQKTQFETEIGQMQESLNTFNRLMTAMLPHIEQGNLFVTDLDPARPKFQHYPRQVSDGSASAPALPEGETDTNLPTGFVSELMTFAPTDAPTIFVSAQPGAGKSTLLHHMADSIDGNVILIQIHEQIYAEDYAAYGDRLRVIGMSNARTEEDEWDQAMRRACQIIDKVFHLMKKRYTQKPGKPILLLIDEYLDIRGWAKENGYDQTIANVTTLCTSRARKVGIAVVLASQTSTASQLGFDGKADVLRGMTTLTLIRDRVSNHYRTIVRIAGGEPVNHQPLPRHPVVETQRQRRDQAALSLDHISVDDELAAVETEAFDLSVWRDGMATKETALDGRSRGAKITAETVKAAYEDWMANNDQAPTLADISRLLGVSISTKNNQRIKRFLDDIGRNKGE